MLLSTGDMFREQKLLRMTSLESSLGRPDYFEVKQMSKWECGGYLTLERRLTCSELKFCMKTKVDIKCILMHLIL